MLGTLSTMQFWITLLANTAVLGAVAGIVSPWYKTWIEKSINYRLDRNIEEIKSKLRREEELANIEIKRQSEQINNLQSGLLSEMSARRAALAARKLLAVERIWKGVVALSPAKMLVEFSASLDMGKMMDAAHSGPDAQAIREMADMLWNTAGIDGLKDGGAGKVSEERPFVTDLTWALYQAYSSAVMHPALQFVSMKNGMPKEILKDEETILKPIREALPEWGEYIDKYGLSGAKSLVGALELKLVEQLRRELQGEDDDAASIAQASRILEKTNQVGRSLGGIASIPAEIVKRFGAK